MPLKIYLVPGGPPSVSVRQTLSALDIKADLLDVNFGIGEHMTEEFAKMNPQKEVPVLEDDGFYLSESNAILQYLCDKYKPQSPLYPADPKARAIVNNRLCFNLSIYYRYLSAYAVDPIFYDYERNAESLKRVHIALEMLERYLRQGGTTHAAADHLTIADLQLINSTMTLEAIAFDFSKYERVQKWYNEFKKQYPELWKISEDALKDLQYLNANPPDMSCLAGHPLHPIKKTNK